MKTAKPCMQRGMRSSLGPEGLLYPTLDEAAGIRHRICVFCSSGWVLANDQLFSLAFFFLSA